MVRFSVKPRVGDRLTSFSTERSAAEVVDRTERERQSLPDGLAADGVWADPAVLSVQASLVMPVSVPAPAMVVRSKRMSEPTAKVPVPVVSQVTTLPATVQLKLLLSDPGTNVSLGPSVSVTRKGLVGE